MSSVLFINTPVIRGVKTKGKTVYEKKVKAGNRQNTN
jgi:hypothetical protein